MADDDVAKGQLRLYSSVRPALSAGTYTVRLEQAITSGGAIAPVDRPMEVTAPRFTLAGTEVQSVFPPPNASGAFDTRLAQIVLRRRTLPWERAADGAPVATRPPWMALVILGDGEANFLKGVSIADAMPQEVRSALGVTEQGTCDALEVSSTVVDKAFPREDELEALCHVRRVNLQDTELATGDDDGYLAVVVCNRLPQQGQTYGAYLVSLEGQLPVLPDPVPPAPSVGTTSVYEAPPEVIAAASYANTGGTVELVDTEPPEYLDSIDGEDRYKPVIRRRSAWQTPVTAAPPPPPAPAPTPSQGTLQHATDFAALEPEPPVLHRFPVLAHWQFTCSTGGDFQALMSNLDVGLLGTPPNPSHGPKPATRLEVADTGHTVVDQVTWRGEPARAWYRGPFVPRQVVRRAAPVPYHVADQALRFGADGRADVSLAAAFELGRLLALSDPRYAAVLHRWRRAALAARRVAAAVARVPGVDAAGANGDESLVRTLGVAVLAGVAADGAAALGDTVPPTDVDDLLAADDAAVIAEGLGLPAAFVGDVLAPGLTRQGYDRTRFESHLETDFNLIVAQKVRLGHLAKNLTDAVAATQSESNPPAAATTAAAAGARAAAAPPRARDGGRQPDVIERLWPGLRARLDEEGGRGADRDV
ncbi:MAG TPA: hypothetical protein VGW75_09440 [Solirubrobacteraceae bacterium]|jgi:hypothetical protein|nr:hypothetical protein [Solirubrobacteraceae bacterium]